MILNLEFTVDIAPEIVIVNWVEVFSQQRALIGYFEVTWYASNNETVSRQNLWAGNIAKSMTSEGDSTLLPANVDLSRDLFL